MTVPVIDGHNDLPWRMRSRGLLDADVTTDLSGSGMHTDVPRLRAGGVGAQFWSVYVPCEYSGAEAVRATLEQIDIVHRLVERHPAEFALATTADEVESARAQGRIASLIGAEGGHSIGDSLGALRSLYRLGVRYMTLTHNKNTAWADSATDEPGVGGLNAFGRDVVREMNRLGMIADLSHVAPSTMHAVLDVSAAPAFFSHSSALALCGHVRNVPDDVLARVRATQGVVMVAFVPAFLTEPCREWWQRFVEAEASFEGHDDYTAQEVWLRDNPQPPCGVSDVADHVEHVREVAGVDCVGLGSDFDGIVSTPDGLTDVSTYPLLFDELRSRGWSTVELRKLGWDNTLRVLRATEDVATP
ncbi:dipeptidase [Virgisporangium aliadipatigenens]|uniref:Dipeptidase n=1 Tax=Virgisporangium aliadipatigenens TaxID=741659 RepID=A0A8J3YXM2_9ACTN|nr:dipeptidase [Virgisporangium aliadipatigenens]GIJ51590.1 dipeptidase [Virgisporangium aliadipatigenens]